MTDATRKLLFDVLEAGRAIRGFVQSMTLREYLARPANTFRGRTAV
jgi:hypothetical protein